MPSQIPEAEAAIRRMDEARARLKQEARELYDSEDYARQRDEARDRYRALREKHNNLERVIEALRRCTIRWGPIGRENAIGNTDRSTDPPTITLSETWQGIRDAVVAQVLAHEAIHVLSESGNSVDQEIRCRRKEMEVWELLKGDERHGLDLPCEYQQRLFAQGEDVVREFVRGAYGGIPEQDPPPPPPPPPAPPRRRGRMRIAGSDFIAPGPWDFLGRSLRHFFLLLMSGPLTEREYGFSIRWPRGYAATETTGLFARYSGLMGTGPAGSERGFPAVFSVLEAPDVIHGGEWASFDARAQHRLEVWRRFGAELPGGYAEILQDAKLEIDGRPARCVEAKYEIVYPEADRENSQCRVRERAYYTQAGSVLYSISLICEAADWDGRAADLERAVKSFRFTA